MPIPHDREKTGANSAAGVLLRREFPKGSEEGMKTAPGACHGPGFGSVISGDMISPASGEARMSMIPMHSIRAGMACVADYGNIPRSL